jgi:hypothetical protein
MPATAPQRRKRPHPARGARRLAGWLSVVAMAGLTGGMVTASRSATTGTSATRSTVTSVSTTASSDDGSTSARSSSNVAARAGRASSQPVTVSHAS